MASDAHHLHPLPHLLAPSPPSHLSTAPVSPSKHTSSLVDHTAARNWKEVWKELAPYHSFSVTCDADEEKLHVFKHSLMTAHPLGSSGSSASFFDLIVGDSSDRVPILVVEAFLAVGVDVEPKASVWLRPEYNATKKAMFMACLRPRPSPCAMRGFAGRFHTSDDDLSYLMKQHSGDGSWCSLTDLARDGKWYALRNRMRRGAIDEDEFRDKVGATGKTCQQVLLERADRGVAVELAYRYPYLFKEAAHFQHHAYEHHHGHAAHAHYQPHHEPLRLGSAVITRFDITPPEKERQITLGSSAVGCSSKSSSGSGSSAGSSLTLGRLRRVDSDNGSPARGSNGEDYEAVDVAFELGEVKRWLMDVEKKVERDRVHFTSREKALTGKIADLSSQVCGLAKTVKSSEINEKEEKIEDRRRTDDKIVAEVKAAANDARLALAKTLDDIASKFDEKFNELEKRIKKLEDSIAAMTTAVKSSDQNS